MNLDSILVFLYVSKLFALLSALAAAASTPKIFLMFLISCSLSAMFIVVFGAASILFRLKE